jgi:hypothetical protein
MRELYILYRDGNFLDHQIIFSEETVIEAVKRVTNALGYRFPRDLLHYEMFETPDIKPMPKTVTFVQTSSQSESPDSEPLEDGDDSCQKE